MRDLEFSPNFDPKAFVTQCGENGVLGTREEGAKAPTLSCTAVFGSNSGELAASEASVADLNEILGNGAVIGDRLDTYRLGVQIGNSYNGGAFVLMPAAEVKGEIVNVDGLVGIKLTATARRSTQTYDFYLAIG